MFPALKVSTVVLAVLVSTMGTAAVVTYHAGAVRVSVVGKKGAGANVHLIIPS